MRKNLLGELENELIEAEIHFSFDFVIQKLLSENCQRVKRRIILKIQRIQYILHH